MSRFIRRRLYWIELGLAALTGTLTLLTLLNPDWVEVLFGIEPDQGGGQLEVAVTVAGIVVTVIFVVFARIEWRRLRPASSIQQP